jgi:hypothetical protein
MPMRINVHAVSFRENLWLPMPVSNFHSSHSIINQKRASLKGISQRRGQMKVLKVCDNLLMHASQ